MAVVISAVLRADLGLDDSGDVVGAAVTYALQGEGPRLAFWVQLKRID